MSVIVLVSPLAKQVPLLAGADYAGVDAGALCCLRQGIDMVFALGDFDTAKDVKEQIGTRTDCYVLPCHKNETDMESAWAQARQRGYETIILYGVLQGRFDHTLANLSLLLHRDPHLILMDENNRVRLLSAGEYEIPKAYTYLSFFALEESCISEEGVAYPLTQKIITTADIFTVSNEIVTERAHVIVHSGRVLMIESNDMR